MMLLRCLTIKFWWVKKVGCSVLWFIQTLLLRIPVNSETFTWSQLSQVVVHQLFRHSCDLCAKINKFALNVGKQTFMSYLDDDVLHFWCESLAYSTDYTSTLNVNKQLVLGLNVKHHTLVSNKGQCNMTLWDRCQLWPNLMGLWRGGHWELNSIFGFIMSHESGDRFQHCISTGYRENMSLVFAAEIGIPTCSWCHTSQIRGGCNGNSYGALGNCC